MCDTRKERRRQRVVQQVIPLVCDPIEAERKVQRPMPTAWKRTSLGGKSTLRVVNFFLGLMVLLSHWHQG